MEFSSCVCDCGCSVRPTFQVITRPLPFFLGTSSVCPGYDRVAVAESFFPKVRRGLLLLRLYTSASLSSPRDRERPYSTQRHEILLVGDLWILCGDMDSVDGVCGPVLEI